MRLLTLYDQVSMASGNYFPVEREVYLFESLRVTENNTKYTFQCEDGVTIVVEHVYKIHHESPKRFIYGWLNGEHVLVITERNRKG